MGPAAAVRLSETDPGAPPLQPVARAGRSADEAAFRELYARTAPRLHAYARGVGGWADLADDVIQETFVRYLAADVPSMTEEQTMSYLYKITTRLTIDRWRDRGRERRWLGHQVEDDALESVAGETKATGLGPDLDEALERLSPRERALVWLAYVEGRSHKDIARVLGVAAPSVRVLLFRARRRLARILDEAGLAPVGS